MVLDRRERRGPRPPAERWVAVTSAGNPFPGVGKRRRVLQRPAPHPIREPHARGPRQRHGGPCRPERHPGPADASYVPCDLPSRYRRPKAHTLRPAGEAYEDINGRAAAIVLPRSVVRLRSADGEVGSLRAVVRRLPRRARARTPTLPPSARTSLTTRITIPRSCARLGSPACHVQSRQPGC